MNSQKQITDQQLRIVLIEDNPGDAVLLQEVLNEQELKPPFSMKWIKRLDRGCDYLRNNDADIILLDLSLPDSYDIDTFINLNAHVSGIPVVILTGNRNEALAQQALKLGAEDYLVKEDLNPKMIWRVLQYSLERSKLKQQLISGEERMKILIEQNRDGILIVDRSQIVRYMNQASVNILPKACQPVVGEEFEFDLLPGQNIEKKIVCGNGEERIITMMTQYIDWQNEKVFMITLSDVTEQKRAEELARQEAALQHVQELAGAICHEFSQPLQTLWILQDMENENAACEENRQVFRRMMDRLSILLGNLRKITKLEKQDYLDTQIIDLHNSSSASDTTAEQTPGNR